MVVVVLLVVVVVVVVVVLLVVVVVALNLVVAVALVVVVVFIIEVVVVVVVVVLLVVVVVVVVVVLLVAVLEGIPQGFDPVRQRFAGGRGGRGSAGRLGIRALAGGRAWRQAGRRLRGLRLQGALELADPLVDAVLRRQCLEPRVGVRPWVLAVLEDRTELQGTHDVALAPSMAQLADASSLLALPGLLLLAVDGSMSLFLAPEARAPELRLDSAFALALVALAFALAFALALALALSLKLPAPFAEGSELEVVSGPLRPIGGPLLGARLVEAVDLHADACLGRLVGDVVHHLPPGLVVGVEPPGVQFEVLAQVVRHHVDQEGPLCGVGERRLAGDLLLLPQSLLPLLNGVVEKLEVFDFWRHQGPDHRPDLVLGVVRVEAVLEAAPGLCPIAAAPLHDLAWLEGRVEEEEGVQLPAVLAGAVLVEVDLFVRDRLVLPLLGPLQHAPVRHLLSPNDGLHVVGPVVEGGGPRELVGHHALVDETSSSLMVGLGLARRVLLEHVQLLVDPHHFRA